MDEQKFLFGVKEEDVNM